MATAVNNIGAQNKKLAMLATKMIQLIARFADGGLKQSISHILELAGIRSHNSRVESKDRAVPSNQLTKILYIFADLIEVNVFVCPCIVCFILSFLFE